MNRLERIGMRLAESLRRESELISELRDVQVEKDRLVAEIQSLPPGELYESTEEQPLVRPFVPTVGVEDPPYDLSETVRFTLSDDTLTNLATEETRRLVIRDAAHPCVQECGMSLPHWHDAHGKVNLRA